MSRYETQTWKNLENIQNELSAFAPVDILTVTGFMSDDQLELHLACSKRTLEKYKAA